MKKEIFLIVNMALSLAIGLLIYMALDRHLIAFGWVGLQSDAAGSPTDWSCLVRCYLPDMLWAYSLTFGVRMCLGTDARLVTVGLISALFAVFIESAQLSTKIMGTFDIWDIVSEVFAVLTAVLVINRFSGGKII